MAALAKAEAAGGRCLAAVEAYRDAAQFEGLAPEVDLAEQLIRSGRQARDAHATLRPNLLELLGNPTVTQLDDVVAAAAKASAASREVLTVARHRGPNVSASVRAQFALLQADWEASVIATERLCAALREFEAARRP